MKNTEIAKGVIVQQDQQSSYPTTLPLYSVNANNIETTTRKVLQTTTATVGSSVDVTNAKADYSVIQTAINYVSGLGGGKVFILAGSWAETLTIPSEVFVEGVGHQTFNTGTITFTGNNGMVKFIRNDGDVFFNISTDGNRMTDCWLATTHTVTNNGGSGNYWDISQE